MCCSEESLELLEFWFALECERERLAEVDDEALKEAA